MTLRARVISGFGQAGELRAAWDALAIEAGRPYSAPGWMLSWWLHVRPEGGLLRIVAVEDEEGALAGIVPLFAMPIPGGGGAYRLLAGDISPGAEPLAREGERDAVARAAAETLAKADPAPAYVEFEGVTTASGWTEALAAEWPGRPAEVRTLKSVPAPYVDLAEPDGFDAWFAAKSQNFRKQMRKSRRKLEQGGFRFEVTGEGGLEGAVTEFARLHDARWDWRGGSNVLSPEVLRMLVAAGRDLGTDGRYRMLLVTDGERAVSAQLFVAAGPEVSWWLGGFDEEWAHARPALASAVEAVSEALEQGESRLDLGSGDQDFKQRFADGERELCWARVVPRGRGRLRARLHLLPGELRARAGERLSPEVKRRLRDLLPVARG